MTIFITVSGFWDAKKNYIIAWILGVCITLCLSLYPSYWRWINVRNYLWAVLLTIFLRCYGWAMEQSQLVSISVNSQYQSTLSISVTDTSLLPVSKQFNMKGLEATLIFNCFETGRREVSLTLILRVISLISKDW